MTAAHSTLLLPPLERLPAIPVPRCPVLRQRDAFDREYLLDIAAAATARPLPGSLPACWFLLDNREHIEAICRDYNELETENRLVAEQLDEAKRRAVAAERARDQAMEDAAALQVRTLLLLAELAVTRHAMAAIDRRYRALRVAFVTVEVLNELDGQTRSTHRGQRASFATDVGVDDTQVIDVDPLATSGGGR